MVSLTPTATYRLKALNEARVFPVARRFTKSRIEGTQAKEMRYGDLARHPRIHFAERNLRQGLEDCKLRLVDSDSLQHGTRYLANGKDEAFYANYSPLANELKKLNKHLNLFTEDIIRRPDRESYRKLREDLLPLFRLLEEIKNLKAPAEMVGEFLGNGDDEMTPVVIDAGFLKSNRRDAFKREMDQSVSQAQRLGIEENKLRQEILDKYVLSTIRIFATNVENKMKDILRCVKGNPDTTFIYHQAPRYETKIRDVEAVSLSKNSADFVLHELKEALAFCKMPMTPEKACRMIFFKTRCLKDRDNIKKLSLQDLERAYKILVEISSTLASFDKGANRLSKKIASYIEDVISEIGIKQPKPRVKTDVDASGTSKSAKREINIHKVYTKNLRLLKDLVTKSVTKTRDALQRFGATLNKIVSLAPRKPEDLSKMKADISEIIHNFTTTNQNELHSGNPTAKKIEHYLYETFESLERLAA